MNLTYLQVGDKPRNKTWEAQLLVGSYPILLKRQPGLLDSEKYLSLRDNNGNG